MAWHLMYLYDPQVPDVIPKYRFFALQNISQECSKEAETEAQIAARHVWSGFQSGFATGDGEKGKLSGPEVVWRTELILTGGDVDSCLVEVFKMAEEMELVAGGEGSKNVGVHEPDETAEQ